MLFGVSRACELGEIAAKDRLIFNFLINLLISAGVTETDDD